MSRISRPEDALPRTIALMIVCLCGAVFADRGPDPFAQARLDLEQVDLPAMRMAVQDLMESFQDDYPNGNVYLRSITNFEQQLPEIREGLRRRDEDAIEQVGQLAALERKALLSNPLLDFDRLLLIKRKPLDDPRRAKGDDDNDKSLGIFLGLPQQSSWQLHTMTNTTGWDNEIAILSPIGSEGELTTLYRPEQGRLVSEMDLHFEADRLMFSMPDAKKNWQVFELELATNRLRQVSPADQPDVHNFDSCYLPNGRIAFISTAPFQGVPCNTGVNVGMSDLMNADGSNVRQICFEQDHNFCPRS